MYVTKHCSVKDLILLLNVKQHLQALSYPCRTTRALASYIKV